MGLTVLEIAVGNPANPEVTRPVEFLIDSGAIYSVVPTPILESLGPLGTGPFFGGKTRFARRRWPKTWTCPLPRLQSFRLADGSKITRKKGVAVFKYRDQIGGADVLFGEEGDSTLLGAFTLEALGLALDPLRRELKPLPMILAGYSLESRW